MRCAHRNIAAWFAGAAIFMLTADAGAEEFRSESGRFRVQMPAGWVRFAPFRLNMVKAGVGQQPGSVVHEGYEIPNRFDGFPFILIQEIKGKRGPFDTYDQIERSLDKEFRKGFEKGAQGNASVGPIVLDRAKNRFTAQTELRLPNGQRANGILYGFLGKESVVMIQCVAMQGDLEQRRAAFDAMADSFRYDEGFQFVPLDTAKTLWVVAGVGTGLCCLLTMIAVVIATVVMLTRGVKPRKRRRTRR